jgi:hypothetical protein
MRQDLFDDHRVFDAGDNFHRATAGLTGLDIDPEHALETLRLYALRVQVMAARWAAGVSHSSSSDAWR